MINASKILCSFFSIPCNEHNIIRYSYVSKFALEYLYFCDLFLQPMYEIQ